MSTSLAPHVYAPHPTMPVPFPLAEDAGYASDEANGVASRYAYSREDSYSRSGYDTPTLYTGTTNTSPTLSVTRIGPSEAPPALRLGPGAGFMGVGTYYLGGSVHGGAHLGEGAGHAEGGVVGSRTGLGMGLRPFTTDSGVIVEREKDGDGRSIHTESTSHSLHAQGSGRSLHVEAESSGRSVNAESSISGIRARVTSLRAPHALSVLIPAFMKRARRKSSRMCDEDAEELRESSAKQARGWADADAKRKDRDDFSRATTEFSCAQSVTSSHLPSDDEEGDLSPTSLDLLSPDPFASNVVLKVGAWSRMYARQGDSTLSPPLPHSADGCTNAHSDCSGSAYGDDDSEEESSIRIYSHVRGRSLSQPDVYTIPIEPLHQSTAPRRNGRSLDRHGLGNWRRPALPARPSLPSLSMLTRKNVVVPIPRSAAAARFPVEPWNDTPRKNAPLVGPATRGLGSLNMPPRVSPPVRGIPFPRSPMRSLVRLGSESSIAEDEDEGEEDEAEGAEGEDGAQVLSGAEDDKVWWSGPSSRATSSRRHSITSSADEPTVSIPVQTDPIVRESMASTIHPRDSVVSQVSQGLLARDSTVSATSHEELDVSSESFLQTLDALDPLNPPPSGRCSSSVEDASGPVLNEASTGVGSRRPGGGGVQGGSSSGYQKQAGGYGRQGGQGSSQGAGGRGHGGSGGGNNGNGGNAPRDQVPTDSDTSESSSSDSDEALPQRGRDTRGGPSTQSVPRPPASSSRNMKPTQDSSDESDDVPLAQRLPTALRAQKSIRLQGKAEREERRQKRLDRMKKRAAERGAPTGSEGGIAPDELAKRLLNVQVADDGSRERSPAPSPNSPMRVPPESNAGGLYPGGVRSRTVSNLSYMSRSKSHTRTGSMEQAPPLPSTSPMPASRLSGRRPSTADALPMPPSPAPPSPMPFKSSLSHSGTTSKSRPSQENPRDQGRTSLSRSGTRHRAGSKTDEEGEASRASRSRSMRDPSGARPPMPPIPPKESYPVSARRPSQPEQFILQVVEQRVYVGDRQRFIVVDIGSPSITAKDVLDIAKQRGELDKGGPGGWHLWEQSNECGMERPVRDFELINDVLKTWNPEKRVNVLIIRRSQMCGVLKPDNVPSSSPLMSGWVMWVSKPGKWNKRWLELKEHGLFLCKNEKGKDQTFLCSLSHFDAYIVTHVPRAPKPYVFAAKSTDGAGFFEKEEDSTHIFSCDGEIGEVWLTRILLARSYVLQQERAVFPRPSNVGSSLSASKSLLSRSGTKKSTVSSRTDRSQHSGPLITDLNPSPFAEGSLLAKAAANGV